MKLFIFLFLILFFTGCSTTHRGYLLSGEVPAGWNGKKAILSITDEMILQKIDSTIIEDGKFEFKGQFEYPRYCQILLYTDASQDVPGEIIPLFVDSTAVTIVCNYSGKKPVFTINNSGTQQEYETFLTGLNNIRAQRKEVFLQYTQAYYYGENHQEALDLARQVSQFEKMAREYQIQYVKSHPQSVISTQIVRNLCDGSSPLTRQEMNSLFASLSLERQNSTPGKALAQFIEQKTLVVGETFPDRELTTPDGQVKKISDCIRPGHNTLIEFWASWCQPCRGDIPQLRETYKKYHDKGFDIISISIDKKKNDWLKALEEEKLPWEQLIERNFQSEPEKSAFKAYEGKGVPHSIFIDENGRVKNVNARGGWLDLLLQEIYD